MFIALSHKSGRVSMPAGASAGYGEKEMPISRTSTICRRVRPRLHYCISAGRLLDHVKRRVSKPFPHEGQIAHIGEQGLTVELVRDVSQLARVHTNNAEKIAEIHDSSEVVRQVGGKFAEDPMVDLIVAHGANGDHAGRGETEGGVDCLRLPFLEEWILETRDKRPTTLAGIRDAADPRGGLYAKVGRGVV
jgi:hypothetical protein